MPGDVDGVEIGALVKHCRNILEISPFDWMIDDETTLGNVASLRFLSVESYQNIK